MCASCVKYCILNSVRDVHECSLNMHIAQFSSSCRHLNWNFVYLVLFFHLFIRTACVCGFSSSPSFCLCLCLSFFFSPTPLSFRITKTNSYKHCIQVSIAFPFILVEIKYYALTSYIFITQLKCK